MDVLLVFILSVYQEAEDPRWARHAGDLQVLHWLPTDAQLRAQHGHEGEEERVLLPRVKNVVTQTSNILQIKEFLEFNRNNFAPL